MKYRLIKNGEIIPDDYEVFKTHFDTHESKWCQGVESSGKVYNDEIFLPMRTLIDAVKKG